MDSGVQIAGILLAAGESKRLGSPKQLLDWKGRPFIWHVATAVQNAGLDPLIIVTGYMSDEVMGALDEINAIFIENPNWEQGQSTSLRCGIEYLAEDVDGVVVFLADQPQVSPNLITVLIDQFLLTHSAYVLPTFAGKRGNPVLFSRKTFLKLTSITGDRGGRAVFSEFNGEAIEWHDDSIHMDVDTDEDYQAFLARYGEEGNIQITL